MKFFHHAFSNMNGGDGEDVGADEASTKENLLYMFIAIVIILPFSLINDIRKFAKTSILGNSFVISTLILIYINDFH